jgi:hypothetical protein
MKAILGCRGIPQLLGDAFSQLDALKRIKLPGSMLYGVKAFVPRERMKVTISHQNVIGEQVPQAEVLPPVALGGKLPVATQYPGVL